LARQVRAYIGQRGPIDRSPFALET